MGGSGKGSAAGGFDMARPYQLGKLRVQGFKSFRDMAVELRALNVLIGANGSGKSNFIAVFRLLNNLIEQSLQVHVAQERVDQLLHHGRKVTREIAVDLSFGRNEYACRLMPGHGDNLVFVSEDVAFHEPTDRGRRVQSLGAGHVESRLGKAARAMSIAWHVMHAMQSWRVYHFHDTSRTAPLKAAGPLGDNRFLRPDGANLAAFLLRLSRERPQHYRNIVDTVRLVAPFFGDFDLRPQAVAVPETVRLEWREIGSDAYFDGHSLSDGTLRFICLATLLLQPDETLPATILFDEPELGLHPFALGVLADLLKSAATRTQLVVSTQSAWLIDQLEVEDVMVVERRDGQSVLVRPDRAALGEWLSEYSLGELWQKNVIGGRPSFEARPHTR